MGFLDELQRKLDKGMGQILDRVDQRVSEIESYWESLFEPLTELFEQDPKTKATVLIGEIGGRAEEDAAEYIQEKISKPVIAYIAGRTAPEGKRMGHAGAIVSGTSGTANSKIQALRKAGVTVIDRPIDVDEALQEIL